MNTEVPRQNENPAPTGNLTVDKASAFRDSLLQRFKTADEVRLDLAAVEDMDLSCIQVLISAMKHSALVGKPLHMTGILAPRLMRRLTSSGIVAVPPSRGEDVEIAIRALIGGPA
jgi:anti-anti-sigma regulatory factor